MATTYRARETFFWGQRVIPAGTVVPADDPVLVKHAALFEVVAIPSDIEQATAAPGERRNVRRRKES